VGFADVVERVSPSVVTVRLPNGVGSGVVLKPDVIVTNAHVVGNARDVVLEFADGEEARGTVLATDEVTDLAVVRSDRKDLPVPEYRTDLPRPGEAAVAIGSPLGFQNSVTAGVISGLNRDIPGSAAESSSLVDLIQTDAPISPGNSGGAPLDAAGRVVGINEAYIPPEVGAVSLGFAIPSGTALDVAEQLLTTGRAAHPYLGISIRQLTSAIQRSLGVQADSGALVTEVDGGGPAAVAGLRPGDVIVKLDGHQVKTVEELLSALRRTRAGAKIPVDYLRGGAQQQVSVTVGERAR
jgi:S1-C subfamily serine protease